MQKELEIAQVNEMKFYLNWDYVKEICNEAIREENQQLKELLQECRDDVYNYQYICLGTLTKIENVLGEKK